MLHTSHMSTTPLPFGQLEQVRLATKRYFLRWCMLLTCIEFDIDKRFFSLSPHLEFHINPLEKSNQPLQFIFPSYLIIILLIDIFFLILNKPLNYKNISFSSSFYFLSFRFDPYSFNQTNLGQFQVHNQSHWFQMLTMMNFFWFFFSEIELF